MHFINQSQPERWPINDIGSRCCRWKSWLWTFTIVTSKHRNVQLSRSKPHMPIGRATIRCLLRADSSGLKEPCIRRGSRAPREGGNLGGYPAHWKALGVSVAVYAVKGIIQSIITARRAMRPFVKIICLLIIIKPHLMHVCLYDVIRMYCSKTSKPIEMLFGGLTYVGPRNHKLDGDREPHEKKKFWGLFGPLKSIGSLCCDVRSKRDHSVLNNGTTFHAAFCQNSLTTCYY